MKDISREVLKKIKEERVTPVPRWHFVFRRSFLVFLFVISIVVGGLGSSVVIFQVAHADWDLYQHLRHSLFEFSILVIPYFWLVFMVGFAFFAAFFFRRTGKGYRYRTSILVLLSVIVSLALGFALDRGGFSARFETIFQAHVPFYQRMQQYRRRICVCPEHGLISGEIVGIPKDGEMRLRDFKGNTWRVMTGGATWRGRRKAAQGLFVKVIGKKTGKGRFQAREIRPWRGMGMGGCGPGAWGKHQGRGMPCCPAGGMRSSP